MSTSAPRRFAECYVATINRGDYARLSDLFAPDAIFLAPNQQRFTGSEAIGAFYERFLTEIAPQIRISSYVEQGDDCVFELEAALGGSAEYALGAIDHATVDADGKVTRMAVFTK